VFWGAEHCGTPRARLARPSALVTLLGYEHHLQAAP
jgi:hypothetical protein